MCVPASVYGHMCVQAHICVRSVPTYTRGFLRHCCDLRTRTSSLLLAEGCLGSQNSPRSLPSGTSTPPLLIAVKGTLMIAGESTPSQRHCRLNSSAERNHCSADSGHVLPHPQDHATRAVFMRYALPGQLCPPVFSPKWGFILLM